MVEVIWTKKAYGQLERAINYIKQEQGSSYAETVLSKVLSTTDLLSTSPKMGTIEPLLEHKDLEYRFIVVWSYKIIYHTTIDKAIISRVFHTSRSPNKL
ncbi:MAG: type II toxin-antitoxin system RelE/ParE family toxin [Reichenbachiella sp.]